MTPSRSMISAMSAAAAISFAAPSVSSPPSDFSGVLNRDTGVK